MKQILSLFLFCTLCFSSCGFGNNKKNVDNQQSEESVETEIEFERTNKDDAKELALQAKQAYEQNRDFEKAIELFEKAVELDSEEEWILADMARVKMEIRDYEGAIKDLTIAMKIKEKNSIEENKDIEQK